MGSMTLYYFHIRDRATIVPDEEGMPLRDFPAAVVEAQLSACELAKAEMRAGRSLNDGRVEITDENGVFLRAVSMRSVLN